MFFTCEYNILSDWDLLYACKRGMPLKGYPSVNPEEFMVE
jgi:hypothetical protein